MDCSLTASNIWSCDLLTSWLLVLIYVLPPVPVCSLWSVRQRATSGGQLRQHFAVHAVVVDFKETECRVETIQLHLSSTDRLNHVEEILTFIRRVLVSESSPWRAWRGCWWSWWCAGPTSLYPGSLSSLARPPLCASQWRPTNVHTAPANTAQHLHIFYPFHHKLKNNRLVLCARFPSHRLLDAELPWFPRRLSYRQICCWNLSATAAPAPAAGRDGSGNAWSPLCTENRPIKYCLSFWCSSPWKSVKYFHQQNLITHKITIKTFKSCRTLYKSLSISLCVEGPDVVQVVYKDGALCAQLLQQHLCVVPIGITQTVPLGAEDLWDFLEADRER